MTDSSRLVVTRQGEVSVIGFTDPTVMDSYHINEIGEELLKLVRSGDHRWLVLDLSTVKMLTSQALGVLLTLRQETEQQQGRIVISGIDPRLYRVFKVTNLKSVFTFCESVDQAVAVIQRDDYQSQGTQPGDNAES